MGTGGGVVAQGLAQAEFEMGLGWMEDEIDDSFWMHLVGIIVSP